MQKVTKDAQKDSKAPQKPAENNSVPQPQKEGDTNTSATKQAPSDAKPAKSGDDNDDADLTSSLQEKKHNMFMNMREAWGMSPEFLNANDDKEQNEKNESDDKGQTLTKVQTTILASFGDSTKRNADLNQVATHPKVEPVYQKSKVNTDGENHYTIDLTGSPSITSSPTINQLTTQIKPLQITEQQQQQQQQQKVPQPDQKSTPPKNTLAPVIITKDQSKPSTSQQAKIPQASLGNAPNATPPINLLEDRGASISFNQPQKAVPNASQRNNPLMFRSATTKQPSPILTSTGNQMAAPPNAVVPKGDDFRSGNLGFIQQFNQQAAQQGFGSTTVKLSNQPIQPANSAHQKAQENMHTYTKMTYTGPIITKKNETQIGPINKFTVLTQRPASQQHTKMQINISTKNQLGQAYMKQDPTVKPLKEVHKINAKQVQQNTALSYQNVGPGMSYGNATNQFQPQLQPPPPPPPPPATTAPPPIPPPPQQPIIGTFYQVPGFTQVQPVSGSVPQVPVPMPVTVIRGQLQANGPGQMVIPFRPSVTEHKYFISKNTYPEGDNCKIIVVCNFPLKKVTVEGVNLTFFIVDVRLLFFHNHYCLLLLLIFI